MPEGTYITHLFCLDCRRFISIKAWRRHKVECRERMALYEARVIELENKNTKAKQAASY